MLKEMNDIKADLHDIRARLAEYKQDALRACNVRCFHEDPEAFIEHLLEHLTDASNNFDIVVDDIELVEYHIDNVVAEAEYQEVARAATS